MGRKLSLWAALPALMVVAAMAAAPKADPYLKEIDQFHRDRDASLKKNWLTLAGLFWLRPGANAIGSDPKANVVLPKGTAPGQAGTIEMSGGVVTLKLNPGVAATVGGKAVGGPVALHSDISGAMNTVEMAGRLKFWVIQRGQRVGIRVQDAQSPEVRAFRGTQWFPADPKWKLTGRWTPSDGSRKIAIPSVIGDVTMTPVAGEATFVVNGQTVSMLALDDAPGTVEFVFVDKTSGTDTYPAGRFLDTEKPKGNTITLDFNKAYNPPCAVTAFATCPLAPKENKLPVAITAGEKFDKKLHPGH